MDEESFKLLGKRVKLDKARDRELPLLINEDWGSEVLRQDYKDRLSGKKEKGVKDGERSS